MIADLQRTLSLPFLSGESKPPSLNCGSIYSKLRRDTFSFGKYHAEDSPFHSCISGIHVRSYSLPEPHWKVASESLNMSAIKYRQLGSPVSHYSRILFSVRLSPSPSATSAGTYMDTSVQLLSSITKAFPSDILLLREEDIPVPEELRNIDNTNQHVQQHPELHYLFSPYWEGELRFRRPVAVEALSITVQSAFDVALREVYSTVLRDVEVMNERYWIYLTPRFF